MELIPANLPPRTGGVGLAKGPRRLWLEQVATTPANGQWYMWPTPFDDAKKGTSGLGKKVQAAIGVEVACRINPTDTKRYMYARRAAATS